jgi:4-hydroxybenzoate polyprenyltransferase
MVRSITDISPIVLIFAVALFAYANLKNFPDAAGDLKAGVRTVFNSYSPRYVRRFVLLSKLTPYVLLLAFVMVGVLRPKFLLALPLVFGPLLIVRCIDTAHSTNDKEVVHAIGYIYQTLSLLVLLILYHTSVFNCTVLLVLFAFSFVVESLGFDSRKYRSKSLATKNKTP